MTATIKKMKPLSYRLLNEQGVVNFELIKIDSGHGNSVNVVVKEAGEEYVGHVELIGTSKSLSDYRDAILKRMKYVEEQKKWDALTDAQKAKKKAPVPATEVVVQVNRIVHDELPYMK